MQRLSGSMMSRDRIDPEFVLSCLKLLRDRLAGVLGGDRPRPHDEWVNRIVEGACPAEKGSAADTDESLTVAASSSDRKGHRSARESSRLPGRLSAKQSERRRRQRVLKARLRLTRLGQHPIPFGRPVERQFE